MLAVGAFTGSVYAIAFLTMVRSMAQRGLAVTMAFANLAMVVPVLLAVAWGERPSGAQGAGFMLAALAVPLLSVCTARGEAIRERPTLSAAARLFVLQGLALSGNLVAHRTLPAASRPGYFVALFGSATVFFASFSVLWLVLSTAVGVAWWRERVQGWAWLALAAAAGATALLNL